MASQRAATAGVVVRARLLHVRDQDDALVGLDGAGNLGDERAVRALVERDAISTLISDRAVLQALAHPRCGALARLEAERLGFVIVGDSAPLEDFLLLRRGELFGVGRPDVRRDVRRDDARRRRGP